jgi:L-fucose isomerase-like protein
MNPMKMLIGACALTFAAALAAPLTAPVAFAAPAAETAARASPKLHATMRELWQGHADTTREYALAVKAGDAAAEKKSADAVVANAKKIADAVGSFYGDAAGKKMLELLAGHWGAVKALTDAQKKNDTAGVNKAMSDMAANADEIAKFLSGANPNLPESAVKGLMVAHAGHHQQLTGEIMKGDKAAADKTWAAMQAHMNTIADALSDGIAKQFPAKAA